MKSKSNQIFFSSNLTHLTKQKNEYLYKKVQIILVLKNN